jgi:serine/threonine-protein kinase
MELIVGESLAARLARGPLLPLPAVVSIAISVSAGLAAAHALGIVHRDLKPDNVMLADEGRVVLTDFGIARVAGGPRTVTVGSIVGTPEYMAPEQIDGRGDIDGRADLYALGVMLFEMLTGEAPWQGDSPIAVAARRLVADPPDIGRYARAPPRLAAVVKRCMARSRDDRYATAAELRDALDASGGPPSPVDSTAAQSSIPVVPSPVGSPQTRRVVAVLQAVNTGSPEDGYLVSAFGDAIFDVLSAHPSVAAHLAPTQSGTDRDLRAKGRELDAEVVVIPTLRVTAERDLRATLRVVSVVEGLQLWAGTFAGRIPDVFRLAGDAAERVTRALVLAPPLRPSMPSPGGDAAEMVARARAETGSSAPFASDRAIARLERICQEGDPPDYWTLSAYASALIRRVEDGDGIVEEAFEAKAMCERAAALLPGAVEPRAALARIAIELGEPSIAASHLFFSEAPRHPSVERTIGLILADAGRLERASDHLARAAALGEPRAPFDDARVRVLLTGEAPRRGLEASGVAAREHAVTGARLALWSCDPTRVAGMHAVLSAGSLPRRDALLAYLSVSPANVAWLHGLLEEEARGFRGLPRRRVLWFALAAEAAARAGDVTRALWSLTQADASGLADVGWLERCPLFAELRGEPTFASILTSARSRAFSAVEALGLEEAP